MQFMQILWRSFPRPIKSLLGKLYYFVIGNDLFLAKRLFFYYLAGPRGLWREANGSLGHLIHLGGLKNTDDVLEIGFGSGRLAMRLTGYLDIGTYVGLDTLPREVEWCRKKIGRNHPTFRFEHADIFNKLYNPRGKIKASRYRFPWDDKTFDFVILFSVFTHMLPQEMANYLSEIRRVLRTGGKCFATFCILGGEPRGFVGAHSTTTSFRFDLGGCRTVDRENPESIVAYEEDLIRRLYSQSGLEIVEPIRYGSWIGRENLPSQQDIVLSVKPRTIS